MRWLVTIHIDTDVEEIEKQIKSFGLECTHDISIPTDDERVIRVEGSFEKEKELRCLKGILDVYPDTDLHFFKP